MIRTYDPVIATFGNLYSNLLDYIVSAALVFYIFTIAGVFYFAGGVRGLTGHTVRSRIHWFPHFTFWAR